MFLEKYGEEVRKIMKIGLWLLGLIAVFFLFQILSDLKEYKYIGKGVYPARTISVNGTGEVYAIPDIGRFTFSVNERAQTVDEAQVSAAEKGKAAIDTLKGLGVDEDDIKTENYSVSPRYEYSQINCITFPCPPGRQELVGYEVNQTMSVKVRDLEKSGELIAAVTGAGATNVSNLSFTIDDMDAVRADARELAIEDAKERAHRLERDLGVRFIKITGFYENEGPQFFEERAMAFGGDAAFNTKAVPELPVGENKIVSTVTLIYEIK